MGPKLAEVKFNVVLIEPEIPNNTGNIGRTCVGTHSVLHLVGKLGFEITDRQLKRAGLDYWQYLEWYHHPTLEEWLKLVKDPSRVFFFSKKASKNYWNAEFRHGDWLVFGKETKGLDEALLQRHESQCLRIPYSGPIRSLNQASAVAVALFEGLRQLDQEPT